MVLRLLLHMICLNLTVNLGDDGERPRPPDRRSVPAGRGRLRPEPRTRRRGGVAPDGAGGHPGGPLRHP